MDFNSEYIKALFKQFCDAKGITVPSPNLKKAFTDWVVENYKVFLKYQEYLWFLDENLQYRDIMEINNRLKEYCEGNNCTYIDMYNLLLDDEGNFSEEYTDDGLHPNDRGYEVITEELKKYLD